MQRQVGWFILILMSATKIYKQVRNKRMKTVKKILMIKYKASILFVMLMVSCIVNMSCNQNLKVMNSNLKKKICIKQKWIPENILQQLETAIYYSEKSIEKQY
jgi:uncharacterized membrane protein